MSAIAAGVALFVWAYSVAATTLYGAARAALHRRRAPAPLAGPFRALVVRPCAGAEPDLERALLSLAHARTGATLACRLAVGSPSDPAAPIAASAVEALRAAGLDAEVVITRADAPNHKAAQLAAVLAREERPFDAIVIADSDVDLAGFDLDTLLSPLFGEPVPEDLERAPARGERPRASGEPPSRACSHRSGYGRARAPRPPPHREAGSRGENGAGTNRTRSKDIDLTFSTGNCPFEDMERTGSRGNAPPKVSGTPVSQGNSRSEATIQPLSGGNVASRRADVASMRSDVASRRSDVALRRADVASGALLPGAVWAPPVEVGPISASGDRASQALLCGSLHAFTLLGALDGGGLVGKLFAVRRDAIEAAGGFGVLSRVLGEDMELARRLARAGRSVGVAPVVARSLKTGRDWQAAVDRYARWLTVIRAQRPHLLASYPLLFIASPLLLLGSLLLAPFAPLFALATAVITLTSRLVAAVSARLLAGLPFSLRASLADAALSDALLAHAFLRALGARTVTWRGSSLTVDRGGALRKATSPAALVCARSSPPGRGPASRPS